MKTEEEEKKKLRKKLGKLKFFISLNKIKMQRGYSYISTFGIPFLVARSLGEIFPQIGWIGFFIPALIIVWVMGHVDFKRGFYGNELELSLIKNPEWMKKMGKRQAEKNEI